MDVSKNTSRYSKDQWLKFGHLAVFDLSELMTGSDLDCEPHINQKIGKNGLVLFPFYIVQMVRTSWHISRDIRGINS